MYTEHAFILKLHVLQVFNIKACRDHCLFDSLLLGISYKCFVKVCPDCISETVRYKMLILGRGIGWGCRYATSWCDIDLTLPK